ncbi:MAG: Uncharacterized protein LiPW16_47 [Microgenomates group bacterium LiPW_16]|nr:MAG: Uncharacterized protein LiPW16_47 [Microgenomates group bacterium LiPW_16]
MKKAILAGLLFLTFSRPVSALENNKVGIHVTQIEDLEKAAQLVNSSGGDWGYVTIVIQETDRNYDKWQKFFDTCRQSHLIPLVRIATHLNGDTWEKPSESSIEEWANFLNSLNWPVKNQYVIVFNEPNHAKEWGDRIDPGEYAIILDKALTIFKQKNPDFFVLNAGFDQAAPDSLETMEEARFLREMEARVPGIFSRLDGWVSHSYPNHGFVGKPWETGRATVKGYEWELAVLKGSFNLAKDLPVFVSETGWPHSGRFYHQETVAQYFKLAFENVWLQDAKVLAITPFILNYPYYPFEYFSWLDALGNPYSQYEEVKTLKKVRGEPEQKQNYELVNLSLPPFLMTNFVLKGKVILSNTGQSIWGEKELRLKAKAPGLKLTDLSLPAERRVKPGETVEFLFTLEAPATSGDYTVSWEGLAKYEIRVFDVWGLTGSKNTPLNSFLEGIFGFWYGFKP